MRFIKSLGAVVVLLLGASACGGPDLDQAASDCSQKGADLTTSDGGKSLIISSQEMDGTGVSSTRAELANAAALCVLDRISAPASVVSKITETRALDGTQSDSIDGADLTWNYHPDDGISLIVERP